MNFDDNSINPKLNLQKNTINSNSELGEKVFSYNGDIDYEKNVINKPTLNGKVFTGDMVEEDPTMIPIDLSELNAMFNSVFDVERSE